MESLLLVDTASALSRMAESQYPNSNMLWSIHSIGSGMGSHLVSLVCLQGQRQDADLM